MASHFPSFRRFRGVCVSHFIRLVSWITQSVWHVVSKADRRAVRLRKYFSRHQKRRGTFVVVVISFLILTDSPITFFLSFHSSIVFFLSFSLPCLLQIRPTVNCNYQIKRLHSNSRKFSYRAPSPLSFCYPMSSTVHRVAVKVSSATLVRDTKQDRMAGKLSICRIR